MSFLPSEVHRLVLGFLRDSACCPGTAEKFLEEAAPLAEVAALLRRKRPVSLKVAARSLEDILDEYSDLQNEIGDIFGILTSSLDESSPEAVEIRTSDSALRKLKCIKENLRRQQQTRASGATSLPSLDPLPPLPAPIAVNAAVNSSKLKSKPPRLSQQSVRTRRLSQLRKEREEALLASTAARIQNELAPVSAKQENKRSVLKTKATVDASSFPPFGDSSIAAGVLSPVSSTHSAATVTTAASPVTTISTRVDAAISAPATSDPLPCTSSSLATTPMKSRKNALKARIPMRHTVENSFHNNGVADQVEKVKKKLGAFTLTSNEEDLNIALGEPLANILGDRSSTSDVEVGTTVDNLMKNEQFMQNFMAMLDEVESFDLDTQEPSKHIVMSAAAETTTQSSCLVPTAAEALQESAAETKETTEETTTSLLALSNSDEGSTNVMQLGNDDAHSKIEMEMPMVCEENREMPLVNEERSGAGPSLTLTESKLDSGDNTSAVLNSEPEPEMEKPAASASKIESFVQEQLMSLNPIQPPQLMAAAPLCEEENGDMVIIIAASPQKSSPPSPPAATPTVKTRKRRRSPDFSHLRDAAKMLRTKAPSPPALPPQIPKASTSTTRTRSKVRNMVSKQTMKNMSNFRVSMASVLSGLLSAQSMVSLPSLPNMVGRKAPYVFSAVARAVREQQSDGGPMNIVYYNEAGELVSLNDCLQDSIICGDDVDLGVLTESGVVMNLGDFLRQNDCVIVNNAANSQTINPDVVTTTATPPRNSPSASSPSRRQHLVCAVTPSKPSTSEYTSRNLTAATGRQTPVKLTPVKLTPVKLIPFSTPTAKASPGKAVVSTPALSLSTPVLGEPLAFRTPAKPRGEEAAQYYTPTTAANHSAKKDMTPGLRFLQEEGERLSMSEASCSEDSMSPSRFQRKKERTRLRQRLELGGGGDGKERTAARKNIGFNIEQSLQKHLSTTKSVENNAVVRTSILQGTPSKLVIVRSPSKTRTPCKMLQLNSPLKRSDRATATSQHSPPESMTVAVVRTPIKQQPLLHLNSPLKRSGGTLEFKTPKKQQSPKRVVKRAVLTKVTDRSPLRNPQQSNWEARHDVNNLDNYRAVAIAPPAVAAGSFSRQQEGERSKMESSNSRSTRRRHLTAIDHPAAASKKICKASPKARDKRSSSVPPASISPTRNTAGLDIRMELVPQMKSKQQQQQTSMQDEGGIVLQTSLDNEMCSALGLVRKASSAIPSSATAVRKKSATPQKRSSIGIVEKKKLAKTKEQCASTVGGNSKKLSFKKAANGGQVWCADDIGSVLLKTGKTLSFFSLPPFRDGLKNIGKFDIQIAAPK